MSEQLQAIKDRWGNKGPWVAEQSLIKRNGLTILFSYCANKREVAEISNAPTDIADLLAEIERLQAENEKLKSEKQEAKKSCELVNKALNQFTQGDRDHGDSGRNVYAQIQQYSAEEDDGY